MGKCPQFSRLKNGGHFERRAAIGRRNTLPVHRCARAEVNKFLFAYVILFKHVYFRQYFACLRQRIFNYCKRITVKLKLKFEIEQRWLSQRLQAVVDAIFPRVSYCDINKRQYGGCHCNSTTITANQKQIPRQILVGQGKISKYDKT